MVHSRVHECLQPYLVYEDVVLSFDLILYDHFILFYNHCLLISFDFEWGTLWCISMTFLSWKFTHRDAALRKALFMRLIGSGLTAIGLIGITLTAVPIFKNNPDYIAQRIEMSLQEPMLFCTHTPKIEMIHGAVFEWLLVIGMLFVSWTFNTDLQEANPPKGAGN